MHQGPGFYQQDKAKEKLSCDDKEDEDNGLQKNDKKISHFNINQTKI